MSPRELELYLHLLSGTEAQTWGQLNRELSEIFGHTYWKNQVYTSLPKLRELGLIEPDSYHATDHAIDDVLDRLQRYFGKAYFDPKFANAPTDDEDSRIMQLLTRKTQPVIEKQPWPLDNLWSFVLLADIIIGKLQSNKASSILTPERRQRFRFLMEQSKASVLQQMAESDPVYKTSMFRTILKLAGHSIRFANKYLE